MSVRNPLADKLDIIILAGQSNMEGYGLGDAPMPWIPNERILMMCGEVATHAEKYIVAEPSDEYYIEVADERYSKDSKVRAGVFALEFARRYCEEQLPSDRKLLLVQTAVGGTGFAGGHWGACDVLYQRMLDMTDKALSMNPENRIVGMLWHQGEHDAYEKAQLPTEVIYEEYERDFAELINGVRRKFGTDLPIVAAGFTRSWIAEYPEQCSAVTRAADAVISTLGKGAFISDTQDLKSNDDVFSDGDTAHFSKEACYTLGERYYRAYCSLVSKKQ